MLRLFSKWSRNADEQQPQPSAEEQAEMAAEREAHRARMDRIVDLASEGVKAIEAQRDELMHEVSSLREQLLTAESIQDQLRLQAVELQIKLDSLQRIDAEVENLRAAAQSVLNLLK